MGPSRIARISLVASHQGWSCLHAARSDERNTDLQVAIMWAVGTFVLLGGFMLALVFTAVSITAESQWGWRLATGQGLLDSSGWG